MKQGDLVRVYPEGSPERAATGTVVLCSNNSRSIAVGLGDSPGFPVSGEGVAIHPQHGIMLLASREEPSGPWTELFAGGRFQIEEIS